MGIKNWSLILIFLAFILSCTKTKNSLEPTYSDTSGIVVKKPNLYIYPEHTTRMNVRIIFPKGGKMTASIPDYTDGWSFTVTPGGLINDSLTFLFYECRIKDIAIPDSGWIFSGDMAEHFFRDILSKMNLTPDEINDFIAYWVRLLEKGRNYELYPLFNEQIEPYIHLSFSPRPEHVFRFIFMIKPADSKKPLAAPRKIPAANRDGFHAVEWGGIMG